MSRALVSIIIPAKDAEKTIEKCINSILNIDYPDYEVIVVDDSSKDNTRQILEKHRLRIEIISNPSNIGPSESRNIAAKRAKGEYLAFTDADCIVNKDWIRELLRGFQDYPQAVGCGGIQKLPQDATDFEAKVFLFMQKAGFISDYARKIRKKEIIAVNHNPSYSVMYKRDVFLKEGGFLEGLWPGEDVELDYRLKKKGYAIVFNPKAIVYHYRSKDPKSFFKMMYRYGYAQGYLVKKYGIFRKIQVLPVIIFILTILFLNVLYLNWRIALGVIVPLFLGLFIYLSRDLFFGLIGIVIWHLGYIKGITSFKTII